MKTHLVLQGEFAVVDAMVDIIATTKPLTCHLLLVHEKKSNLLGLFHLDAYTDAEQITKQLFESIKAELDTRKVASPEYRILFSQGLPHAEGGPTGEDDLKTACEQILKVIATCKLYSSEKLGVIRTPLDAKLRTALKFSLLDNTVRISTIPNESNVGTLIQTLQGMEYGDFNRFMDRCYGTAEPPFFIGKRATRTIEDLPEINNCAQMSESQLISHLNEWVRHERIPFASLALNGELSARIDALESDQNTLRPTLLNKNYNLLLRQLSTKSSCLPVLSFLLAHAGAFGLDSQSSGKKSGPAIKVAEKFKNDEALRLLSVFAEKQEEAANQQMARSFLGYC